MSDKDTTYDKARGLLFQQVESRTVRKVAFQNAGDYQSQLFEYIKMYYNPMRLHSSIGCLNLNNFKNHLASLCNKNK